MTTHKNRSKEHKKYIYFLRISLAEWEKLWYNKQDMLFVNRIDMKNR